MSKKADGQAIEAAGTTQQQLDDAIAAVKACWWIWVESFVGNLRLWECVVWLI